MSGTVAIDTLRVEDWERRTSAVAAEPGPTAERLLRDNQTEDHGAAPPAPWSRRKLNEALADLGPMRPGGRAVREPWSRAKLPRSDASSTASHVNDDSMATPEWPRASSDVATTRAGDGANPGVGPGVGDLPPPPRPSRPGGGHATIAGVSDPTLDNWGEFALAEDDAAGADIVRALAEANLTVNGFPVRPLAEVAPLDGDEPLERPPMIIERAIAEQGQGLSTSPPTLGRGSPLPGLAVGFTLSLMAGAALYLVLASG
jgi:hypothetical protein